MHLSPAHLSAFQGGKVESAALAQDLARGARYLDELIAADVLVIGTPMYNHGVPSQLKAWIDRVVVGGKTFRYTERGPEGLLAADKKVFIAASSGGLYSG
jgi:FMN-dependent NADH-azoreductase